MAIFDKSKLLADSAHRCQIITKYLFHKDMRQRLYDKLFSLKVFEEFMCVKQGETFISYAMARENFNYPYELKAVFSDELTLEDIFYVVDIEYEVRTKRGTALKLVELAEKVNELKSEELAKHLSALVKPDTRIVKFSAPEIYKQRKQQPAGILTGIKTLDNVVMGLEYGTLTTVFGFVGHYKTLFLTNLMYNALSLGYNSVFITLEVPKEFIYFQLLSRHSYNTKFAGKGDPISSRDIRKGTLTSEQEKFLFEIVEPDFKQLSGKFHIVEQADVKSCDAVSMRAYMQGLPFKVDVVLLDYIQLLISTEERSYEQGNFFVREFTKLALGRGRERHVVVLASQANREGYKRAEQAGGVYDLRAISDINQLERDSYYIVSLYLDDALRASGEVKLQLLKHRGGDVITEPVAVHVDPRFSVIGDNIEGYSEPISSTEALNLFTGEIF